jgi:outer membrane lipoprotein-sorting protein
MVELTSFISSLNETTMKMFKTGLLAATALFSTILVQAQTADEVISKHISAIGGKEKVSQIKSLYMEGAVEIMGNEAPITSYILNGKGYKSEMEFNGQKIINAMNEKGGWMVNPMLGSSAPQALPEEQFKTGKDQMVIGGALLAYQAHGDKAELQGKEKVNNTDAYRIKLTTKENDTTTYFIDANTYYLVKVIKVANMAGQEAEVETSFSDFKKTDYGFTMPYKTEISLPQGFTLAMNFKKVEVNKEIDPKIFEMPAK